jgi:hypothetical protein
MADGVISRHLPNADGRDVADSPFPSPAGARRWSSGAGTMPCAQAPPPPPRAPDAARTSPRGSRGIDPYAGGLGHRRRAACAGAGGAAAAAPGTQPSLAPGHRTRPPPLSLSASKRNESR